MPKLMAAAFSRTMPPRSAYGGWTPRPRKDRPAINRKLKQKRRPNSDISGADALGRISRRMIHQVPSPRSRAASTYSSTVRFMPSARASRNTRVESSTAMVTIKTGMLEPNTPRMMRANIRPGMDSITSTRRVRATSTQPPTTALRKPSTIPIRNDNAVMARATPIVMRVPYMMRVSMSRPIWSAPNNIAMEGSSQVPPILADSG